MAVALSLLLPGFMTNLSLRRNTWPKDTWHLVNSLLLGNLTKARMRQQRVWDFYQGWFPFSVCFTYDSPFFHNKTTSLKKEKDRDSTLQFLGFFAFFHPYAYALKAVHTTTLQHDHENYWRGSDDFWANWLWALRHYSTRILAGQPAMACNWESYLTHVIVYCSHGVVDFSLALHSTSEPQFAKEKR